MWLRRARKKLGLTQQEVASRLGVSQGYLSLLENGHRTVSPSLASRLEQLVRVPATALRPRERTVNPGELAKELATLGYEPLAYLGRRAPANPADVLLSAVRQNDLESRLTEALPWVVFTYPKLNWDWLVERAKLQDAQNRLGFVLTLARQLTEERNPSAVETLRKQENRLERSRLATEGTLCQDSMSQAERRWLRDNRPPEAAHWNLLTNLRAVDLPYAA
jgi:transcriptional regulator with XRE-family HTH domain